MRRAADTNILVRLVTRDDPDQLARALALLEDGSLVVTPTVLLETEWVLRSAFRYSRQAVETSMAGLVALPGLEFIEGDRVARTLYLHGQGMDFADALHLTSAEGCDEFVTFDRQFARAAASVGDLPTTVRLI